MKKILSTLLFFLSINVYAQDEIQPVTTYDGGDLYFIPAKLTSKGTSYLYSYKQNYDTGKTWFTIFDDQLNIIKQSEIESPIITFTTQTITYQRKYFSNGGTRSESSDNGYFLDDWTVVSDATEEKQTSNSTIIHPEIYEDNNNYHSRSMYLSQTLFDKDEDFEFLRYHYEVMPLTYCAAEDKTTGNISIAGPEIGGESCDSYTYEYDETLKGYVFTLTKSKVYGGIKDIGIDIVSLDGTIKKTLNGITSMGTVISNNGNYYVSAYDNTTHKYNLYKIASTTTTSLSKIAEISSETGDNATYNLSGMKVSSDTKGIVIRNGLKLLNK